MLNGISNTTIPCTPAQRPAEVLGTRTHAQLTVLLSSLHYAPYKALGATSQLIAVLVLRSMLKQRRILMRMH